MVKRRDTTLIFIIGIFLLALVALIVVRKNAALTFGVISSLLNGKCFDPCN
jgi:uncharacterized membrane protein